MSLARLPINAFKKLLRAVGVDLVRYNLHHSEEVLLNTIIRNFKIQTILDVGANEGQYAIQIFDSGFKGKIYSFEPISDVYKILQKKAGDSQKWLTFNQGIGSREEEVMINVSENFVSSSIFNVSSASTDAEPQTQTVRKEKIKITTIDSFFSANTFENNILLKLDIQGFELEALKGALNSLPKLKLIQSELSFVKLYDNIPLYDEVIKFLEQHGYEIFTIIPGFRDNVTGRLFQADGIFVKKESGHK